MLAHGGVIPPAEFEEIQEAEIFHLRQLVWYFVGLLMHLVLLCSPCFALSELKVNVHNPVDSDRYKYYQFVPEVNFC